MNGKRSRVVVVAAVATAMAAMSALPAGAADVAARVSTFERFGFTPGPDGGLVLNWGFDPAHISVPKGSTVKWTNTSSDGEPHTVSVVYERNVPQTIDDIFNCFAPGSVCGDILASHDPDNDGRPPFTSLVNAGKAGLNQQGDSRLIEAGQSVWAQVTSARGSTVHYICAIHPWMQATIDVT